MLHGRWNLIQAENNVIITVQAYDRILKFQRKEIMIPKDILQKYHILQLLHHGIGGDVWLAEHIGLAGKRVLKTIEKGHPQYDILIQEARLLQQCRHPSIPIIYDILEFDTQTYIVEEFIEGENLKQYILKMRSLSDSLLLDFSIQLCEILQFLHNPARPVLHLDLKPENILITNHRVKLIDFGSAIYRNRQNGSRFIFGTPAYCAPEMKKAEVLTEQADIYSLGKCMEYMQMHVHHLPKGYQRVVERCLRKEGKYYLSVEEIHRDLKRIYKRPRTEKPRETWFAVSGVLSEQDSMNVSLQIAMHLNRSRKGKVLYLDCSRERWVERLEKKEKNCQGFVFEQEGITIAKRVAVQELTAWIGRGYRYIVCDFGKNNPMTPEISFTSYLYAGTFTEMTLPEWEKQLSSVYGKQKLTVALCGGDEELAVCCLGEQCQVCCVNPFFSLNVQKKRGSSQMKRLLR